MVEGWTYGPVRNDDKKQTPCMVAYEDLPDSEKEYDRATSQETLKLILKSGFAISKKYVNFTCRSRLGICLNLMLHETFRFHSS